MRLRFCLSLLVLLAGLPGAAHAQAETVAIAAPVDGQAVAGLVLIVGTAASPQFQRYEVDFGYEPNPTDTWFPVRAPSLAPQSGGPLAEWDTLALGIADGVYTLRLRLVRADGTTAESYVRGVVLQNGRSPVAVTGLPATGAPTATATGVVVDLPPTTTPRPSATPFPAGTPAPTRSAGLAGPTFDRPSFGRAFVRGIAWAAGAFALLAVYAALRPWVRPRLRQLMRRLVKPR